MKGIGLAAGIVSLIAGILELIFGLFLTVYVLMFGMVAVMGASQGNNSDVAAGVIAAVIFAVLLLAIMIAAGLHILAAIGLLRNKPNKVIMWAATAGSLIPMCTFYCAICSIPAGILLLITLLTEAPEDELDPDILV